MAAEEVPISAAPSDVRFYPKTGRQINIVDSVGDRPFAKATMEGVAPYLSQLLNGEITDKTLRFSPDFLDPSHITCAAYVLGQPNKYAPYGFLLYEGAESAEMAKERLDLVTAPTLNTEHGAFTRNAVSVSPAPA